MTERPRLAAVPEQPWGEDGENHDNTLASHNGNTNDFKDGAQSIEKLSPLHAAAINGKKQEILSLLQEYKDEIDMGDHMGRTPLMYSILGDRFECALMLLKAGADLDCVDVDERTSLHWAAYQGNHKFVKALLAKGADRSKSDKEGRTPLHLCTSHQNIKVLHLLLKDIDTEEIDLADDAGMTALQWASFYGQVDHARLLIKAGATINCFDNEKRTALHWASSNDEATIAKLVLANDFTILNCKDSGGRTSLHYAVGAGSISVVSFLLSMEECSYNEQDSLKRTPLHWAAVLGNTGLVELLLDKGVDYTIPDSNGVRALQYAAQNDFAETTSAMLSHGNVTDIPDDNGRTSLMWAAGKGAFKALNVLVQHNHDVKAKDSSHTTALHMAAYGGHMNCVVYLIENGAKVNAQDSQRYTPLFHACEMGHMEIVDYLLNHGASVEMEDLQARSCLHIAALGGRVDICSKLIEAGIDPGKGDILGRPPLHGASYGGFVACMKLLIDHGADVDALDKSGVSSLHWACACGSLDAVKLLITNSAFQNFMENKDDRLTPLDYAIIREHQDVAQYMIENNALTIAGIQDLAATVIESAYRGHLVRKNIKQQMRLGRFSRESQPYQQRNAIANIMNTSDSDSVDTKISDIRYASKMRYRSDRYESETSTDRGGNIQHQRKKKYKNLKAQAQRSSLASNEQPIRSKSANATLSDLAGMDQGGRNITGANPTKKSKDKYNHRFSPSLNDLRYLGAGGIPASSYDTRSVVSAINFHDQNQRWQMPSYSRQPSNSTDLDVHSLKTFDLMSSNEDFSDFTAQPNAIRHDWGYRRQTSESSSVSAAKETQNLGLSRSHVSPPKTRINSRSNHDQIHHNKFYANRLESSFRLNSSSNFSSRYANQTPDSSFSSSQRGNRVDSKTLSSLNFNRNDALPSSQQDKLRKERARRDLIRRKVNAVIVIQRAVRKFLQRRREEKQSNALGKLRVETKEELTKNMSNFEMREIAALVIQLAWRSYIKRRLLIARRRSSSSLHSMEAAEQHRRQSVASNRSKKSSKSPTARYNAHNSSAISPSSISPRTRNHAKKSSVDGLRMTPDSYSVARQSPYSYNLVTREQGRNNKRATPSGGSKSPANGTSNFPRW